MGIDRSLPRPNHIYAVEVDGAVRQERSLSDAIAHFAQAAHAGALTASVTIDGQPGFRWWADEKGVPHTAYYYYVGGPFQENVGDAAREFIEDLLGHGPIRDLIRLDDD